MSSLEEQLVHLLLSRGATLAVAESMTGGALGGRITRVPGAGDAFLGGFITYTDDIKARLLDIDEGLLENEGAVTPAIAQAMAQSCRAKCRADLGLAITGLAGPTAPDGLPVGLTYLGLATADAVTVVERRFQGSRGEVREAAIDEALRMALAAAETLGQAR